MYVLSADSDIVFRVSFSLISTAFFFVGLFLAVKRDLIVRVIQRQGGKILSSYPEAHLARLVTAFGYGCAALSFYLLFAS